MHQDVSKFWFEEINPSQWFAKAEEFDQLIDRRFSDRHCRAVRRERNAILGRKSTDEELIS